jgi:hypothetical protein
VWRRRSVWWLWGSELRSNDPTHAAMRLRHEWGIWLSEFNSFS